MQHDKYVSQCDFSQVRGGDMFVDLAGNQWILTDEEAGLVQTNRALRAEITRQLLSGAVVFVPKTPPTPPILEIDIQHSKRYAKPLETAIEEAWLQGMTQLRYTCREMPEFHLVIRGSRLAFMAGPA